MLERNIQKAVVKRARLNGWYAKKFTSPASRSVPDYLFLKNGFVFWIEFKPTDGEPTEVQEEEHKKIRAKGGIVLVCDGVELGYRMLNDMLIYT